MIFRIVILLVAVSLGAPSLLQAQTKTPEKKTIYWLFFELPGAVNLRNDGRPLGYIMDVFNILKAKMPEYTHQVVEVPFLRSVQQMEKKKGVCSLMILKNAERDRFMVFGKPYVPGMPAGVLASKNNKKVQKYVKGNQIDIDRLLTDRDIQFGSAAGRYYGEKISDAIIKNKTAKILQKRGSEVDRELRNLLKLGRIDVYFGYPFEVEGIDQAQFYFVKGNTALLEPRIGCERSPFGEQVIARTEEIRAKYKLDKEFINAYEKMIPKSLQEEFRKPAH